MKKSLILIAAMIFFFQLSEKSHAAFYLEPFAGINITSEYESRLEEGELTGNQIGGRIGFKNLGFSLGLDARRSSFELEADNSSGGGNDYTGNQVGFFVGYEFPILLRVWANYIFTGQATDDDDDDFEISEANGFNLGAGFKILPLISLNIEYFNLNYDKVENGSSSTSNLDIESSGLILGVSIPLSI